MTGKNGVYVAFVTKLCRRTQQNDARGEGKRISKASPSYKSMKKRFFSQWRPITVEEAVAAAVVVLTVAFIASLAIEASVLLTQLIHVMRVTG